MRVVKPQEVNDATLSSSTIPEPDIAFGEVLWVAGAYAIGDQVIKTTTHRVYECVVATSDEPEGVPLQGINANPPTWVDVAPTNKWAMFDGVNSTQSMETVAPLIVEIATGEVTTSVSGFSVDGASSINVTMTDPGAGIVYDNDISMIDNSGVDGWWGYFFAPIVNRTEFVLLDLPIYPLATIKVTVDGTSDIEFGNLVVGNQLVLGISNYGTSLQLIDFSQKEVDSFGNTTVVRGRTAKLVDYDVTIQKTKVGYVFNELSKLTGIPSVWVGTDETDDATLVYGYYRDFQNNISSPTITDATITVEGLV